MGGLNQESTLARESILFDKGGESDGMLPRLRINRAWHGGISFDRFDPPIARLGAAFGNERWYENLLPSEQRRLQELREYEKEKY